MTEVNKRIMTNSEYPIPPQSTDEPENMRKVGFRAAEVLVALEEMGGTIETSNLTRLVKDINDYQDGDGATSYHRTVSGLSKRGYIESTKANKMQHIQ
ncbi:MAG: hypothetical protein Q7T74_05880, partial [Candidatus Saccharibacteria bacterium]|nr:hypothetical protein [Candidatus Saccharibacteria bacterium]